MNPISVLSNNQQNVSKFIRKVPNFAPVVVATLLSLGTPVRAENNTSNPFYPTQETAVATKSYAMVSTDEDVLNKRWSRVFLSIADNEEDKAYVGEFITEAYNKLGKDFAPVMIQAEADYQNLVKYLETTTLSASKQDEIAEKANCARRELLAFFVDSDGKYIRTRDGVNKSIEKVKNCYFMNDDAKYKESGRYLWLKLVGISPYTDTKGVPNYDVTVTHVALQAVFADMCEQYGIDTDSDDYYKAMAKSSGCYTIKNGRFVPD